MVDTTQNETGPDGTSEAAATAEAQAPTPSGSNEKERRARVDRRNAELANEVRELRERLGALTDLETQAKASAEALQQLQDAFEQKSKEADELQSQSRRRDFSDHVLSGISHHHQETARLALTGLLAQESDVYNFTDPQANLQELARSAREVLRQRAPSLFSSSPRQGMPDASRPDFSRYQSYSEVPAEMRAQLSDDDFKRLNGMPTRQNLLFATNSKG
jgi:hypothetical protein